MRAGWLLWLAMTVACASPVSSRGVMPPAPQDNNLRNDGSQGARTTLMGAHQVRVEGERVQVGSATRPGRSGVLGTELDPDVAAYLSSAGTPTGGVTRGALTAAGLALVAGAFALMVALLPVPFLGALAAVSAVDVSSTLLVTFPQTRAAAVQLSLGVALTATIFVVVVVALFQLPSGAALGAGSLMIEGARRKTLNQLESLAGTYNHTLEKRIDAAAVNPPGTPEASQPMPGIPPAEGGSPHEKNL